MSHKTLITGGVRSGKSSFALTRALAYDAPRIFLATAEPLDEDMKERIRVHKQQRGNAFVTIEEPLEISRVLSELDRSPTVLVVDCMTLWTYNLLQAFGDHASEVEERISAWIQTVKNTRFDLVVVTNEVGLGVMPGNALSRKYVDLLGFVNQRLASASDEVVMMVSGIAQVLKQKEVSHAQVD